MKKFSAKTVIILLMALVLALTLAACNNRPDPPEPSNETKQPLTTGEFFDNLWQSTKSLGATPIADTDDLKLSLDLGLKIAKMSAGDKEMGALNLGIAVDLVLDRLTDTTNPTDGTKSAAKIGLYNKDKGKADGNLLTAYYFLDQSDVIYIDFNGQQIKIGFDTGYNTYNGTTASEYGPDYYANVLNGFLENDLGNGITIDGILNIFTQNRGSDWDIDVLATALLKEFNLEPVLDNLFKTEIKPLGNKTIYELAYTMFASLDLHKVFGIDDGETQYEGTDILNSLLKAEVMGLIFNSSGNSLTTYRDDPNRKTYRTEVDTEQVFTLLSAAQEALGNLLNVVNTETKIKLAYETVEDDIDSFSIYVGFRNLIDSNQSPAYYPAVTIDIEEFSIEKADLSKRENALSINKADYTDEFNIGATVKIDTKGLVLNPALFGGPDMAIDLSNKHLTLQMNACIDLSGKENANKTTLAATLKDGNTEILAATFKDRQLIIKVNNDAMIQDNVPYAATLINMFGDHIVRWLADTSNKGGKQPAIAGVLVQTFFTDATFTAPTGDAAVGYSSLAIVDGQGNPATLYYKPIYKEGTNGLVVNNVDITALFQSALGWPAHKPADPTVTPAQTAALSDASTASGMTVYNGLYQVDDKGNYLHAADNRFPVVPNIVSKKQNILMSLATLFDFPKGEEKITVSLTSIENYLRRYALTGGEINYLDASGTLKNTITASGLNRNDILYLIFAKNQSLVNKFTDAGLIETYKDTANVEYYKHCNMLDRNELKLLYEYITGQKTYADYKAAVPAESGKQITEDAFNTIIETYAPAMMFKYLAGSSFLTGSNPQKMIDDLFSESKVEISIDYSDGLGIGVEFSVGGTSIGVSADLTLSSGLPSVPVIELPASVTSHTGEDKLIDGWYVVNL